MAGEEWDGNPIEGVTWAVFITLAVLGIICGTVRLLTWLL